MNMKRENGGYVWAPTEGVKGRSMCCADNITLWGSLLPATLTLATRLTMLPSPSSVARHWYSPSSGRWCRECITFCTSSEPFASCCRLSSTIVLSNTPSLRHAMEGGSATASDCAWQSSCSVPPCTVTVSWGSWEKVNSIKLPKLDEEEGEEKVSDPVGGGEKVVQRKTQRVIRASSLCNQALVFRFQPQKDLKYNQRERKSFVHYNEE